MEVLALKPIITERKNSLGKLIVEWRGLRDLEDKIVDVTQSEQEGKIEQINEQSLRYLQDHDQKRLQQEKEKSGKNAGLRSK